jgi:iron complex outermembrane receptor protein
MPLGTATWIETPVSDPTDLYLSYRNFGNVDLWGIDIGLTFILSDAFTITGSYSLTCGWIDSGDKCANFFPNLAGVDDVALNSPNNKGMLGVGWRNPRIGLGIDLRGRYIEGYPVDSGVFQGDIPSFTLFDANIIYDLPMATGTRLTVTATNIFSCVGDTDTTNGGCGFRDTHQEMIGAPFLGRMVLFRLSQTF